MSTLTGKVALVTGGSRGIGAATSKRLARDGATVALSYNASPDAAEAVVGEITAAGGTARAYRADAADAEAVAGLVRQVVEDHGGIDVLVNNAGVYLTSPVADATDSDFARTFDVNVRAVYAAVRAAAPHLAGGGRIVNIGSVNARTAFPGQTAYAASKAAVTSFTGVWAKELGARGITVNTVQPGPIDTEMNPADPARNPMAGAMGGMTVLGRYGTADEIANAVAFLVSDQADYITGAELTVDGGMTA